MKNIVVLLLSSFCLLTLDLGKDFQQKCEEVFVILFIIFFNVVIGIAIYYYIRKRDSYQCTEQTQKLQLLANSHLSEVKHKILVKGKYETSIVYLKVKSIVQTLIKVDTKENLNEEEWKLLIMQTDAKWNHIVTYLEVNYNLSVEEIMICCLYLANVPVKHVGHFINGYARSTIQLKAREIVMKMGLPQGILLKEALHSLSNELRNVN